MGLIGQDMAHFAYDLGHAGLICHRCIGGNLI